MRATITITNPEGGGVVYVVTDKPRVGMGTPEKYRAEVARIVAMAEADGSTAVVVETEGDD